MITAEYQYRMPLPCPTFLEALANEICNGKAVLVEITWRDETYLHWEREEISDGRLPLIRETPGGK